MSILQYFGILSARSSSIKYAHEHSYEDTGFWYIYEGTHEHNEFWYIFERFDRIITHWRVFEDSPNMQFQKSQQNVRRLWSQFPPTKTVYIA
jgi:hypothetical protein